VSSISADHVTETSDAAVGVTDVPRPSLPAGGRRMRILLSVHSAGLGGAERLALAEAEYLKQAFDLIIAVPDGPLRAQFARHGELIDGTVPLPLWGDSARSWLVRLARTVADSVALTRALRRHKVDAVLANSAVCLAPRFTGAPVIVHARDVPASRLAPLVFRLEGMLADTIIVISAGQRPYFAAGRRARIIQIPDGIEIPDLDEQQVSPTPPPLPGDAVLSGDRVRLCLIGGVDPRKGQDIAVQAVAELRRSGLEAELDLVGREIDPSFAVSVRQLAQRLGVAQHVTFVGELDDVRHHLQQVDVVIAPSRDEWTPLSLMEAMALRKPVVAAAVGGVNDLIEDGVTGSLIAPEDARGLASAIAAIAADPERARAMAFEARRSVTSKFAINVTLEGAEHEVRRLIDPRRVPSPAS
jgi:glycosyltransferase involved in cell wall biosynthesis